MSGVAEGRGARAVAGQPAGVGRSAARAGGLALAVCFAYVAVVVALKTVVPDRGWAFQDASESHFPVINYFIAHGFDRGYPPLLAMLPGMHLFFAGVARALQLPALGYDGWPAFLIQSLWGVAFLVIVTAVWRTAARGRDGSALLLLPILCSSYPLYSWLWPTTDVGAYTCYAGLLLVMMAARRFTPGVTLLFCLLVIVVTMFRQNYAVLAAAPLAQLALERGPRRWLVVDREALARAVPLAVAAALVVVMLALWHGLVPPELARHGSHGAIEIVPVVHIFAVTGLIGLPFALPYGRQIASSPRLLAGVLAVSVLVGAACAVALPLGPDPAAGRYGSIIWTLAGKIRPAALSQAVVGATIAAGLFIWLAVVAQAIRRRAADPELILMALFAATFFVQAMSWQRYVEFIALFTLAVNLARTGLPGRPDRTIFAVWFGLYALVSVAKPFLGGAAAA